MATVFGRTFDKADFLRHVGSMNQVGGIREYTYNSGRADGVRAIHVNTGPLQFEILLSRCLDISYAWYNGIPFGFATKSGVRHPAYFMHTDQDGFLRNFLAGVLTTCGYANIGPGKDIGGKHHELHDEAANVPADRVSVREDWDGDECRFTVSGDMRHGYFYDTDLLLRRTITTSLGASSIRIEDVVENQDFYPAHCFLLYHCNFGFPFLQADSRFFTPEILETIPRGEDSEKRAADFASCAPPKDAEAELCFYHRFKPDREGHVATCLFNPGLGAKGMGVYVRYDARTLPNYSQWKTLRSREYVLGMEPANAALENWSEEKIRENTLAPMESRTFTLEIGILEGEDACRAVAAGK